MNRIFCKPVFLLFFVFITSHFTQSFSQSISKSDFRKMFTQGNLMILEGFYDTAVKTFLQLNTADPSNANINYKIGLCYLNIPSQKSKAIDYLENAIKQTTGTYLEDDAGEKNAPENAIYLLGKAYHYAYRFEEATSQFKKFRDLVGKWNLNQVKEIDQWNRMSMNAKEIVSKPVECTITNLGDSVNGPFADYSPVISADESMLVFTSRRQGTGGADNRTIYGEFLEDIWICNRGPFGTWTKAKGISRTINTEDNEAGIGLSADGQQLYVYRDDKGDGNIYISKLDGDFWSAPFKMDASNINSDKWEPSACISADGSTLYFVSNRKGGFGGRDIYKCNRLPNRAWSEPQNLGPTINTAYDEDAPFIHPDGTTFFFSSTGHNTIGGFDVFYSVKVANDVWTAPINIGFPINTTDDDIYFVTSSDGRRAYYASFQPGGKGEKDIYMVSMAKPFVKSVAILVGYLKNKDGSLIPKQSSVGIKSSAGEMIYSKPNEASGKFTQSLVPNREYEINIETNGNKIFASKFFLPEDSSYQALGRGFFQRTIYLGNTTNVFLTTNTVKDTFSRIEVTPVDGRLLLSKDTSTFAPNVSIQLLNSFGNIIATTVTSNKGYFKFQNIPSDQKYIIKINESDPLLKTNTQFYLANKESKVVMSSSQEGKFFVFKNIPPELNKLAAMEDKGIPLTTMSGKLIANSKAKTGLAKVNVNLVDEKGKVIESRSTDQSGRFSFENLTGKTNYSLSINKDSPALKNNKELYLVNEKEEIIKKISKMADFFIFEALPADLNKLNAIDITDNTELVAMTGKILKSPISSDGISNLDISLVDKRKKVIRKTRTDDSGAFVFENISPENNYAVKLNQQDSSLYPLKKIYLANQTDKVVKAIDLDKSASSFTNLPADLLQLAELKDVYISTGTKNNISIEDQKLISAGDKNFDFVVYFPYNKKEIDISNDIYAEFMKKVAASIKDNGKAVIIIAASSSSVPTTSYKSNEILSRERANAIKEKIRTSINSNGINSAKISYEIDTKVQGPEYKNDALENRKEYEKWQFVKVLVKQ